MLGVDDVSRVGALRFKRAEKGFERSPKPGERRTPPLLEIRPIIDASHALERGTETEQDRAVTKGEVLALRLAARAGVNAADARIVYSGGLPVAVVRRFDRVNGDRVPYAWAASMLQASRHEERSYTEIADQILRFAAEADSDLHELWRRIVFNLLITNVDDHLANHGFLHVAHGLWRLAPAFDLNPFPDKERELKTWLSAETGPSASLADALGLAPYFHLDLTAARGILRQVNDAVAAWRELALKPEVDMSIAEAKAFEPAFEHEGRREAERLLKQQ